MAGSRGTARRSAGTPATWGDLTTEDHGGRAIVVEWPWAPGESVTVTFLERGHLAGTLVRVLEPAVYEDREVRPAEYVDAIVTPAIVNDDTGEILEPAVTEPREVSPAVVEPVEVTPAVTETVERWTHYCEHPEWGRNAFELDAGHPVEVSDA